MSFHTTPEPDACIREFFKVTPSTGSGTTSDIDKHLTSLANLQQPADPDSRIESFINKIFPSDNPIRFEFVALSTGKSDAVKLYYSTDGKAKTLEQRLKSIYPSSFSIERVEMDLGARLVSPVKMTEREFKKRYQEDTLYQDRGWYVSDSIGTDDESGDVPNEETESSDVVDPLNRPEEEEPESKAESSDEWATDSQDSPTDPFSTDGQTNQGATRDDGHERGSDNSENTLNVVNRNTQDESTTAESDSSQEYIEAGGTNTSSEHGQDQDTNEPSNTQQGGFSVSDVVDESNLVQGNPTTRKTKIYGEIQGLAQDNDSPRSAIDTSSELTETRGENKSEHHIEIAETGDIVYLNGPEAIPDEGPLIQLQGPTRTPDGHILARPALEDNTPNAVKWYGKEDAPGDWMTTLNTATESNPEYESGDEEDDVNAPEALQTLFSHLEETPQPIAYQVVFEAKQKWNNKSKARKKEIRSGKFRQPLLERIFGGANDDEDRDLKAYEYRRIKLIENKRPRKTFHCNIRAVSLTPNTYGERRTSELQRIIDQELDNLIPLLDPLDGVYYSIEGSRAPEKLGFFDNELTADEVVDNFFQREIIKIEDERARIGKIDPWDNRRKHPEIIVNGREIGELVVIPSGDDMDNDVFRSTGTTSKEMEPLRRPRPEIHKELKEGVKIGYAYDENGIAESTPTCIPEHKLNNHWAMFGASGSGKTVNTISMLLSAYEDTSGPTVVIDPKQGDMIENYCKAHYARHQDLEDVYIFSVPETLPSIPFFDIRPHLHEGLNRDDAIQQKADEFHMIMNMIDENYDTAYVAKTVLGALIKSLFDYTHGSDNYTLDDLYEAAMRLYTERDMPRVSHQPQVTRIFENQINKSDQEFKNTMQAVLNRLDDLQEDINLHRLFNQNPEWDSDFGTYKYNLETDSDDTDEDEPEPEHTDSSNDGTDGESDTEFDTFEELGRDNQNTGSSGPSKNGDTENGHDPFEGLGGIGQDNSSSVPNEIGDTDEPRSALDFRTFLDEDCIILFDSGSFVRDESQQAFSMYVLTALWGSIRARYKSQDSHESIDNITKVVIEESSPIVSTDLVTHTLIPEAREFGLSLGMIMQYPSQVSNTGVEGSFDELKNNVGSKIYGHIDPSHDIADSLVHDEKDTQAIKNKIRRLGGGEWIADLPAPTFGVEVPPPFSLTSLEIPEGHPESDRPLTDTARSAFNREFTERKEATRTKHGVIRPDAETLAKQNAIGTSTGFSEGTDGTTDDDYSDAEPVDTPAAESDTDTSENSGQSPSAQPGANIQSSGKEAGLDGAEIDMDTEESGGSHAGRPQSQTGPSANAQSGNSPEQGETTDSGQSPLADVDPMPRDDLEAHVDDPTHDELDELTDTALALSDQLDEATYKRAALTLAALAGDLLDVTAEQLIDLASQQEQGESTAADADNGEVDVSDVDSPDGSNVPNATEMESNTDDCPGQGEPPDGSAAAAESSAGTSDDEATDTTADIDIGDKNTLIDADELDLSDEEALAGVGKQPSEPAHDDGGGDSDKPHPTNVELDSPLDEAHTDLTATERDDYDLTSDDEQFMALIADAFRGTLNDYELTESMTSLRDRAGNPDVDKLEELGYIEETFLERYKYYSLTRTGWRIINDGVPGNKFGDHMEKIKHRVGVHLLVEHTKEIPGIGRIESYERYNGETYDMVAYDRDGDITVVAEVETSNNNDEALIEDYEKLADAPGDSMWVFPSNTVLKEHWSTLQDSVLEHEVSDRIMHRAKKLQDHLDSHPEAGADMVKVYSQLQD